MNRQNFEQIHYGDYQKSHIRYAVFGKKYSQVIE